MQNSFETYLNRDGEEIAVTVNYECADGALRLQLVRLTATPDMDAEAYRGRAQGYDDILTTVEEEKELVDQAWEVYHANEGKDEIEKSQNEDYQSWRRS